jgi:hypothetical protein
MEWLPFQEIGLSPEHGRVLQDTDIDENGPGTILHDFEALLAFLRLRDLPVTPTHQLPRRVLSTINERMANPLKLGLKRPLQGSYPHVNGLYLLMLASGLVTVGGTSKEPLLVTDDAVYQAWQDLNPTERYFTLLEAWLLRGYPELIGREGRRWYGMPETFSHCSRFVRRIPDAGLAVGGDEEIERRLRYRPGWHNLGLLELFGLIAVQHDLPESGKGWRIQRIRRTSLGIALFALLHTQFFDDVDKVRHLRDEQEIPFGLLQPMLQVYFPEWKSTLPIAGREHPVASPGRQQRPEERSEIALDKQWLDVLIKGVPHSEARAADVRAEADELTSLILATNDMNDDTRQER